MKQNNQSTEILQTILPTLTTAAQQHYLHATINIKKGFLKLGNRMLEEYTEETETIGKIVERILELGGEVKLEYPDIKFQVFENPEDQLRNECAFQFQSIELLEKIIRESTLDIVTENFLIDYLADETEHAAWLKQQVDLINTLGINNYLTKQI